MIFLYFRFNYFRALNLSPVFALSHVLSLISLSSPIFTFCVAVTGNPSLYSSINLGTIATIAKSAIHLLNSTGSNVAPGFNVIFNFISSSDTFGSLIPTAIASCIAGYLIATSCTAIGSTFSPDTLILLILSPPPVVWDSHKDPKKDEEPYLYLEDHVAQHSIPP